ncbi:MAG: GGDEF domain-containing protein, partial [Agathobacter sp.]|nr:GGDEF domain-containing protein [Agathobacter sp.]
MIVDIFIILALILLIYYLVSIISLLSERKKLARILDTDVITGGYNMQYFVRKGNKLLKKNRKGKYNYAVVTIRMEKYRNFCSCYGVKEGEELMESFYQVLNSSIGKKELLAHAEKADFALLLTYNTENELIWRLRELMIKMNAVKSENKKYFSAGVFGASDAKDGIDSMYNCAGVARKAVTEDSEDRIVWFNDKMNAEQFWNRKVENDMERALQNREFQVYLQPKYSTKEEVLSGAEALVRWIHPTEGFVAPYRFIPIFENNGFIIQLDDYMLTEVARQQAKWIAEGKRIVPISVNVSRVHFVKEDLAEHICQIVDQFKVPHEVIELELTESAFFDDKEVLLNTIHKLKEYGFKISMDDFGAGYSSLNSLKELPLDVVKLDAGFFRDEDESGRGKVIVEDTIALAKKLDMRIVAEGIETREQVDFLASMNCDLIQGYYFAKPMPIADFEEKAFGQKVYT